MYPLLTPLTVVTCHESTPRWQSLSCLAYCLLPRSPKSLPRDVLSLHSQEMVQFNLSSDTYCSYPVFCHGGVAPLALTFIPAFSRRSTDRLSPCRQATCSGLFSWWSTIESKHSLVVLDQAASRSRRIFGLQFSLARCNRDFPSHPIASTCACNKLLEDTKQVTSVIQCSQELHAIRACSLPSSLQEHVAQIGGYTSLRSPCALSGLLLSTCDSSSQLDRAESPHNCRCNLQLHQLARGFL